MIPLEADELGLSSWHGTPNGTPSLQKLHRDLDDAVDKVQNGTVGTTDVEAQQFVIINRSLRCSSLGSWSIAGRVDERAGGTRVVPDSASTCQNICGGSLSGASPVS